MSFGAGMADAGLSIDLDVVKGNLEPALDLLRQILTEPVFPQTEVARQVRTRIAEIEQERSNAAHRAGLEFVRTFYAPDDRSSRPTGGTRETVSSITREDVAAFHAEHVVACRRDPRRRRRPRAASTCRCSSSRLSGRWAKGPRHRERHLQHAAALAPDRGRIVLVSRPGSVQTELVIGAPGSRPVRRGRLGALPGARLRPRRFAQRPHRRGPA